MKNLLKTILILSVFIQLISCNKSKDSDPTPMPSSEVAVKWADVLLFTIYNQQPFNGFPSNSPTFISRGTGYVGLTMFESIVAGSGEYQSIAPQLNGLGTLPAPEKTLDLETSLNAGQSYIIKKLWWISSSTITMKIDSLEKAVLVARTAAVKDTAIINYSIKYGQSIAEKIYQWSKTDGGNDGNQDVFNVNSVFPKGADSLWVPPTFGQTSSQVPMHPKWGSNRTFVAANASLAMPTKLKYSTDTASLYYKQFKEVYTVALGLTQEQKEIAAWWSDDPSATYAPPGHSYNMAKQLVIVKSSNLIEAASAFAKVGMATADAFINCWKVKYKYFSERPAGYIRRTINPSFGQIWPEPPFPAFSSGHATQAAAMATALISVYGDNVTFTDNTNLFRLRDAERAIDYKARTFNSIWASAVECAMSRLYGGIHSRPDNDQGLAMGKIVGDNISKINWKK